MSDPVIPLKNILGSEEFISSDPSRQVKVVDGWFSKASGLSDSEEDQKRLGDAHFKIRGQLMGSKYLADVASSLPEDLRTPENVDYLSGVTNGYFSGAAGDGSKLEIPIMDRLDEYAVGEYAKRHMAGEKLPAMLPSEKARISSKLSEFGQDVPPFSIGIDGAGDPFGTSREKLSEEFAKRMTPAIRTIDEIYRMGADKDAQSKWAPIEDQFGTLVEMRRKPGIIGNNKWEFRLPNGVISERAFDGKPSGSDMRNALVDVISENAPNVSDSDGPGMFETFSKKGASSYDRLMAFTGDLQDGSSHTMANQAMSAAGGMVEMFGDAVKFISRNSGPPSAPLAGPDGTVIRQTSGELPDNSIGGSIGNALKTIGGNVKFANPESREDKLVGGGAQVDAVLAGAKPGQIPWAFDGSIVTGKLINTVGHIGSMLYAGPMAYGGLVGLSSGEVAVESTYDELTAGGMDPVKARDIAMKNGLMTATVTSIIMAATGKMITENSFASEAIRNSVTRGLAGLSARGAAGAATAKFAANTLSALPGDLAVNTASGALMRASQVFAGQIIKSEGDFKEAGDALKREFGKDPAANQFIQGLADDAAFAMVGAGIFGNLHPRGLGESDPDAAHAVISRDYGEYKPLARPNGEFVIPTKRGLLQFPDIDAASAFSERMSNSKTDADLLFDMSSGRPVRREGITDEMVSEYQRNSEDLQKSIDSKLSRSSQMGVTERGLSVHGSKSEALARVGDLSSKWEIPSSAGAEDAIGQLTDKMSDTMVDGARDWHQARNDFMSSVMRDPANASKVPALEAELADVTNLYDGLADKNSNEASLAAKKIAELSGSLEKARNEPPPKSRYTEEQAAAAADAHIAILKKAQRASVYDKARANATIALGEKSVAGGDAMFTIAEVQVPNSDGSARTAYEVRVKSPVEDVAGTKSAKDSADAILAEKNKPATPVPAGGGKIFIPRNSGNDVFVTRVVEVARAGNEASPADIDAAIEGMDAALRKMPAGDERIPQYQKDLSDLMAASRKAAATRPVESVVSRHEEAAMRGNRDERRARTSVPEEGADSELSTRRLMEDSLISSGHDHGTAERLVNEALDSPDLIPSMEADSSIPEMPRNKPSAGSAKDSATTSPKSVQEPESGVIEPKSSLSEQLLASLPAESAARWTPEELAAVDRFGSSNDPAAIADLPPIKRRRAMETLMESRGVESIDEVVSDLGDGVVKVKTKQGLGFREDRPSPYSDNKGSTILFSELAKLAISGIKNGFGFAKFAAEAAGKFGNWIMNAAKDVWRSVTGAVSRRVDDAARDNPPAARQPVPEVARTRTALEQLRDAHLARTASPAQKALVNRIEAERRESVARGDIRDFTDKTKSSENSADKYISNLLSELGRIHPKLRDAMVNFEFRLARRAHRYATLVDPLANGLKRFSNADSESFNSAVSRNDTDAVTALLTKYSTKDNNLHQRWQEWKESRDLIAREARDSGLDFGFVEEYFPRRVKDYDKFMDYLTEGGYRSFIDKALSKKEKSLGRKLTNEEEASVANAEIARYFGGRAKSGHQKGRKISEITDEMAKFYYKPGEQLSTYAYEMAKGATMAEFFGQDAVSSYRSGGEFDPAKPFGENTSIGSVFQELTSGKKISSSDARKAYHAIGDRVNYKPTPRWLTVAKSFNVPLVMNSPIRAITQLQEIATAAAVYGVYNTAKGAGAKKLSLTDLYINSGQQIHGPGQLVGKLGEFVWKVSGYKMFDSIAAKALNGAWLESVKSMPEAKALDEIIPMERYLDGSAEEALADIRAGRLGSEDVKFLAFNALSKVRPVSLSSMPRAFLRSPGGRIFYNLKIFQLHQLDMIRNAIGREFSNGNPASGVAKLVQLGTALTLAGAAIDEVKDFILGRKRSFGSHVADNFMKLMLVSRYQSDQLKKGDFMQIASDMANLPVFDVVESIYRTGKKTLGTVTVGDKPWWHDLANSRLVTNFPSFGLGEIYYNRFSEKSGENKFKIMKSEYADQLTDALHDYEILKAAGKDRRKAGGTQVQYEKLGELSNIKVLVEAEMKDEIEAGNDNAAADWVTELSRVSGKPDEWQSYLSRMKRIRRARKK